MDEPLVTMTVCVRNGVHWIDECLTALHAQTYRPLEIIVVNDGSTDEAKMTLDSWHDPEGQRGIPTRVHHQEALGLSAGRQWALEQARGSWVAITDIDVRPEPDWIRIMMEQRHPVEEGERVVAVTGRTIFERAEDLVSRVRSVEIATKYRSRPRRTSLANGPCSVFERAALLGVGGFDPAWYHAEDMEVSLKLIQAGGTIVYAPEALVRHVPETGVRRFLGKRRRDARAHLRIVRFYSRRQRLNAGFDFIGSSAMVLTIFPLWLMFFCTGIPFLVHFVTTQPTEMATIETWWQTQWLIISIILLMVHEFILWGGPLGVVNRGVLKATKHKRVRSIFGVRRLTLLWSIALWQGLMLGLLDMLLGKNGHRIRK